MVTKGKRMGKYKPSSLTWLRKHRAIECKEKIETDWDGAVLGFGLLGSLAGVVIFVVEAFRGFP